jgi:putative ABC transport system permease protein
VFRWLSQTVIISALSVRTIPRRLSSSAVAVIGIAGVVIVFVAVLSSAKGFGPPWPTRGRPTGRS